MAELFERLRMAVDDLLSWKGFETGQIELEYYIYSLPSIIEETINSLATTAAEKDIRINLKVSEALPSEMVTDRTQIRGAARRLIHNAIKYSPSGSLVQVRLDIETIGEIKVRLYMFCDLHVLMYLCRILS